MKRFIKRKVIVTGATRGIGRGVATAFLEEGAIVTGIFSSDRTSADQFQRQCDERGYRITLVQLDVSDFTAVADFYRKIEEQWNTVDILVNSAGIRRDSLTALMDRHQWQSVIDTNLTGTFNMSRHVIPLMLKQKYGRIINITSPVSHLGFNGQANYAASKAGLIGLTRTLARETARKKITVNCVSPGFIQTDFISDLTEDQLAAYKRMVPMRRFGTIAEVVAAILFLVSEDSSYISGTVLDVTGGI